jgi:hypothetical protein
MLEAGIFLRFVPYDSTFTLPVNPVSQAIVRFHSIMRMDLERIHKLKQNDHSPRGWLTLV